jgi:hypothetical protein
MDDYKPNWIDFRIDEMEDKADNMRDAYPDHDYPSGDDAYDASLSRRFKRLEDVLPMYHR